MNGTRRNGTKLEKWDWGGKLSKSKLIKLRTSRTLKLRKRLLGNYNKTTKQSFIKSK